jgi:RNAse (barnase) inhibitor barstar
MSRFDHPEFPRAVQTGTVNPYRRCSRTDASVATIPLPPAAEGQYRWTDLQKVHYVIAGGAFSTIEDFADYFSKTVLRDHVWRGNLNAFNDILRGGFGTPEEGFVLVWRDHETSRERLGSELFDTLVDIIRDHGSGGAEADDGVDLVLA